MIWKEVNWVAAVLESSKQLTPWKVVHVFGISVEMQASDCLK